MTLAFLINLYPPYIVGGNEMLARDVIEGLREKGHTVHVLTGRGRHFAGDGRIHGVLDIDLDRKEEIFLGGKQATSADLFRWHLYNHNSYVAVRRALREIAPALVVVWNLYGASMAPLIAARRSGIPLVIHAADKWLLYGLKDVTPLVRPSGQWKRALVSLARVTVQPLLYRLARPGPVITISDFIRRVHIEAGFDVRDCEALHLGVPTEMFSPDGRPEPPERQVRFLYVGALWEGKGPQLAVAALGRLLRQSNLPRLHLDLYGQGTTDFMRFLTESVRQAGAEDHVTLHGFVSREKLPDIYRAHDVLVFPSVWDEPFAAVPVEAMACGTPVVGTTAGGTAEAVSDGRSGLLVPAGDLDALATAMARVARDRQLRERLGYEAARIARERWDFRAYVNRLEERYRHFAAHHRGGRRVD